MNYNLTCDHAKIDRHNAYREISGLYFTHHENPMMPLRNSLVDGELVIDVDPRTRQVFIFTTTPSFHFIQSS